MKSEGLFCALASVALVLAFIMPASASIVVGPSSDDLWDVSQGSVVTDSSPILCGSDASNILGANLGYIEPGQGVTLFADCYGSGAWHYVRWITPQDVTVGAFNLYAAHDGYSNGYGRSFNRFELLAKPTGSATWETIFAQDVTVPYAYLDESTKLLICAVLSQPVTAREFEARFRQHTDVAYAKGPRVFELDGFGAVPEPGTLVGISGGLIGLIGLIRKRK